MCISSSIEILPRSYLTDDCHHSTSPRPAEYPYGTSLSRPDMTEWFSRRLSGVSEATYRIDKRQLQAADQPSYPNATFFGLGECCSENLRMKGVGRRNEDSQRSQALLIPSFLLGITNRAALPVRDVASSSCSSSTEPGIQRYS